MTDGTASRLYLSIGDAAVDPQIEQTLAHILAAVPVACLRLDLGEAAQEDWIRAANHVIGPCHAADVALVVVDHFRLVDALGLDGVHLSLSGPRLRDARAALGNDRIVGASAGGSRHQGMVMAEAGADYVSFGPVRAEGLLGDGATVDDALFAWWAEMIETPCVAEGGVMLADVERLSGMADFFVPDPAIWEAADPAIPLDAMAKLLSA